MQDRFDIAKLTQDPLLVARIASAEDLFGFFTREVAVPPACVALVYGSDRHPALLSAGTPLEAGEIREVLFVRTAPFFLEYAMGGLRSSDGFAFDATIQLSVQVVPERIELEAFRRTILGSRREARTDRLRQQCETVVRQAAGEFVTAGRAGELISSNSWEAFDEVLEKAFAGVGFESG
ncbi:MAG TPA: hypothetical protein VNT79_00520, partial [Phycisphaerae bacterium]|nr:hypothetical protein [Phycisphaerae bacterium]